MSHKLAAPFLATAIALSPLMFLADSQPAAAQNVQIGFGYFHDQLSPYGRWYHHPRWGDVWHPLQVEADFKPYYRGHWDYTGQYGWTWASDYSWGDIAFHYGRWVYDPSDGWLWVPGYVWSPAWVVWRGGDGYTGWFPMPPDDAFLAGDEVYRTDWNNWDSGYGYADWYGPNYGAAWLLSMAVFVDDKHFADRDYMRYVAPRNRIAPIVNKFRNITNYTTVNNIVVNRSVDVGSIERASGRRITPVPENTVSKTRTPIVPVNVGRQVQVQERKTHGGDPHASPRAKVAAFTEAGAAANQNNPNVAARGRGAGPQAPARDQAAQAQRGLPPNREQQGKTTEQQAQQNRPEQQPASQKQPRERQQAQQTREQKLGEQQQAQQQTRERQQEKQPARQQQAVRQEQKAARPGQQAARQEPQARRQEPRAERPEPPPRPEAQRAQPNAQQAENGRGRDRTKKQE